MKAGEIRAALRARYSDARRYAVAEEVGITTGYSPRRLDMIVLDCYESNGFRIDGIEIKVSKADLKRELENPSKHVAFFDVIDYYTLACPAGVADMNVIPPKWGVLQVNEDGTTRYRRRPIALHDDKPQDVPRGFLHQSHARFRDASPPLLSLRPNTSGESGMSKTGRHVRRRSCVIAWNMKQTRLRSTTSLPIALACGVTNRNQQYTGSSRSKAWALLGLFQRSSETFKACRR